jgi:hypothetical protein
MWFSLGQHYGYVTPAGAFTEFPIQLPPQQTENVTPGIARDESGHIWIPILKDEEPPYGGFLARIDVTGGAREVLLTTPCQQVGAPVEGSDGQVYAACAHVVDSKQVIDLMLVRPNGEMRIIADPFQITPNPYNPNTSQYMTATPGKIWFVTGSPWGHLGVYDIATGSFRAYSAPSGSGHFCWSVRTRPVKSDSSRARETRYRSACFNRPNGMLLVTTSVNLPRRPVC